MFKRFLMVFMVLFAVGFSYSQKTDSATFRLVYDSTDVEQTYLGKCYFYSHKLGYSVDTFENDRMYQMACAWLRTPYRWGGKTRMGIDCSDFAAVIYDSCYRIKISGDCSGIYKDMVPIEKKELKEGDLVFFKIWGRGLSHVGVYLGKNKFVHASSSRGVMVSDLNEPYYKRFFFVAARHKCLNY
ncbi:MAG: C40 family peptidase [Bacteroidota bacterium]